MATTNYNYTTAAIGWAVVTGVCGASYYYYTRTGAQKRQQRLSRGASVKDLDPSRSRARRTEERQNSASEGASNNAQLKSRSKKQKSDTQSRPTPAISTSYANAIDEPEDDSWATELANKQKGTTFTAPKRKESRQKTVKQTNANKVAAEMSNETSTTGADADDDLSPALSPDLPSSADHTVPHAGDITDMLEESAAGPSVLRITEPEHPTLPTGGNHQKASKAPKQEETKKQRQNRKKNEERKALHEEEEKARRVQLEKQLRTAREARGEPAKNGLAKPPATNAWANGPSQAAQSSQSKVNGDNALLDTFVSENKAPQQPKMNGHSLASKWSSDNLPSEEEQMRILAENDESAWKTVSKKDKKKRKNTTTSDGENGGAVQPAEPPKIRAAEASEVVPDGPAGMANGVH
jgi:hypothetical protein